MATPVRPWYPGMTYHITTRGNRKEIIFRERSDFEVYLTFLKDALIYYEDYKYEVICFCLMSNHVHLVLKCNNKEPGHFMGRVNSRYARYFNTKYSCIGHLFQGRYYAEPITNMNHLLETSRYVHMNPVKAKIVTAPEQYKWSSIRFYIKYYKDRESLSEMYKSVINYDKKNKVTIDLEDISFDDIIEYFDTKEKYMKYVLDI